MKLKVGDAVICIKTVDEKGLYSMYLIKGGKYFITGFENRNKLYVYVEQYHKYVGCYPLEYFFTKKEMRKMKLDEIKQR